MKYSMGIVVIILIVGFIIISLLGTSRTTSDSDTTTDLFVFEQTEFDFGTIKQSNGIVTHDFLFTYTGSEQITVTGLPTSCGCTNAEITPSKLTPGTQGLIKVSFDPNLHAEPKGHFYKTISLLTEPKITKVPELIIWASIDLDLGEDAYRQQTHEDEIPLKTENPAPEKDYRTISASTL